MTEKNSDANAIAAKIVRADTMDSSGLNEVGEALGYDWNEVCDEIMAHGFHGECGDNGVSIRKVNVNSLKSEVLKKILNQIFESNPQLEQLEVLD